MEPDHDVVIVGAGSAGAVLAARLAERPDLRVLLLEAGPEHTGADTPAGISGPSFLAACAEPGRGWPELVATHAEGQPPATYLRGRGVGGSSAVNAMVALRGIPADYDRWADELGCTGWSWADLLPWFRWAEDDLDLGGDGLHGKDGPIPLWRPPEHRWSSLERALRVATAELGYPQCADQHAPGATGFGPAALTVRDDRRVSTNDAYLEPARARPNLTILGDTQVEQVLLDGRRAVGVRTAAGVEYRAPEVWVCAGAVHSPALLLRSGITDRPVGENLVEHQMLPLVLVLNERERARAAGARTVSALLRYSSGLADAGPNDMQMLPLTPFGLEPPESGLAVLGVCATRVFSRGRVTLAPGDPVTAPRIEFRMLSDPRDRERLRDGFRRAVALVRHPAVAGLADLVLAGRTPLAELESAGALESSGAPEPGLDRWMDENVTNYVHAAGSCRMGAPDDPAAVVDLDCQLIGYSGLGVLDASVLPDVPRANTHLTVVAVAERIAARTADRLAGPAA